MSSSDFAATNTLRVMAWFVLSILVLAGPFFIVSAFSGTTDPLTGLRVSMINWSLLGTGIATTASGLVTWASLTAFASLCENTADMQADLYDFITGSSEAEVETETEVAMETEQEVPQVVA